MIERTSAMPTPQHDAAIRFWCFFGTLLVMAVWEMFAPRRPLTRSKPLRWFSNLGLAVLNNVVWRLLIPAGAFGVAISVQARGWGLFNLIALPKWFEVAAAVVLFDLAIYAQQSHGELTLSEWQAVPNVMLQAVAEYDRATQSSNVGTLVALPLPVFNRNRGNIYRAASDIRVACSEIERTKLVLRDLLADSFRRYQTNLKQAKRFQDSILPDAQENLELTERGYKVGESSFLQVLTARQTYIESQLAYVESLTELRKVTAATHRRSESHVHRRGDSNVLWRRQHGPPTTVTQPSSTRSLAATVERRADRPVTRRRNFD